jgi:hypothetical protein
MIPLDEADRFARAARIDRMIEHYRLAKQRRLVRQAMTLWRKIEAHQRFLSFEKPFERIH